MGIKDALELGVLIGFDGQLKQDANVEWYILYHLIIQLYRAKLGDKERALAWLYFKTWEAYGEHVIEYKKYIVNCNYWEKKFNQELWTFSDDDMEAAFFAMAYPKKEESRIDRLNI